MYAHSHAQVNPKLKALLEGEYKMLDCFKRENARRAMAEKAKAKEPIAAGNAAAPPPALAAPVAAKS